MVCSHRCMVVTVDGALYNVNVDADVDLSQGVNMTI
jgi:hypothetical protein